eukprot:TRINITY_DN7926_c0_g2_i1.p3 TRINITY_DN7926_c0_g2~~TRINITY_DN7926_c0_g2_i1.p3  ORF type:complete len:115 (+),score=59.53 TRINITY_DN7926_c0_g2_i1:2-346(+)
MGRVQETEGFPLPPKNEDGSDADYVWVPAPALQKLRAAHGRLELAVQAGHAAAANEALLAQAAVKLAAAGKDLKVLDAKDAEDCDKLVGAAVKAAKKLRKGTKKAGGKKGGKGK